MPHHFRSAIWSGSLHELLKESNPHLPAMIPTMVQAHNWLLKQIECKNNILPIRKHSQHSKRGELKSFGSNQSSVMAVDNEPLCSLYAKWMQHTHPSQDMSACLRSGEVIASWKCDVTTKPAMKFKGVKTPFRDRGLKLAHLFNAGLLEGENSPEEQIKVRFIRSLSPFNVLLFPSHRSNAAHFISGPLRPTHPDLAEDKGMLKAYLGWFQNLMQMNGVADETFHCFAPDISANPEWLTILSETKVEVRPRGTQPVQGVPGMTTPRRQPNTARTENLPEAFPRSNAVLEMDAAIEQIRNWLSTTNAVQLNGSMVSSNDPTGWIHIRVNGYGPADDFTSSHGVHFQGSDYNGIVSFHGDAKTNKLRDFVRLIEEAESYQDVLRPSSTYEGQKLPVVNGVPRRPKPKFCLCGYEDIVDGFFLYHDQY